MFGPQCESRRVTNAKPKEVQSRKGKFAPSIKTGLVEIAPALLGNVSGVRSLLSWAFGLLGFLALVFAVQHFGSPERVIEVARSARPTWLALAVGMLHFPGVSIEAAPAGTLLLRALTFWLPMLPEIWLAQREIGRA